MRTPRFTRRRFVAGAAVFGAALSAPWRVAWPAPEPASRPLVPREVYFGNPDISWARLSYDGASIAYIAPVNGVRNLWVAPLDDLIKGSTLTVETGAELVPGLAG